MPKCTERRPYQPSVSLARFRLLVALPCCRNLLLCAKHLLVAAKQWGELFHGWAGDVRLITSNLYVAVHNARLRAISTERMAATNKFLARNNKSRMEGKATKKRDTCLHPS